MIPKIFCFFSGILVGVGFFYWHAIGALSPPADQETTRVEVTILKLDPKDQWLQNVHFQIVPLRGVLSFRKYSILLMTPPPSGVHTSTNISSTLDLTADKNYFTTIIVSGRSFSFSETIQPVTITSDDFGSRGDQTALLFIDEEMPTDKTSYRESQPLWIGSSVFK